MPNGTCQITSFSFGDDDNNLDDDAGINGWIRWCKIPSQLCWKYLFSWLNLKNFVCPC
jgi:hypothetical protein